MAARHFDSANKQRESSNSSKYQDRSEKSNNISHTYRTHIFIASFCQNSAIPHAGQENRAQCTTTACLMFINLAWLIVPPNFFVVCVPWRRDKERSQKCCISSDVAYQMVWDCCVLQAYSLMRVQGNWLIFQQLCQSKQEQDGSPLTSISGWREDLKTSPCNIYC